MRKDIEQIRKEHKRIVGSCLVGIFVFGMVCFVIGYLTFYGIYFFSSNMMGSITGSLFATLCLFAILIIYEIGIAYEFIGLLKMKYNLTDYDLDVIVHFK